MTDPKYLVAVLMRLNTGIYELSSVLLADKTSGAEFSFLTNMIESEVETLQQQYEIR